MPRKLPEGDVCRDEARRTQPGCPQGAVDRRESRTNLPDGCAGRNVVTRRAWVQLFSKPTWQRWRPERNTQRGHDHVGGDVFFAGWNHCHSVERDRGSGAIWREQWRQLERGNRRRAFHRRQVNRYRRFDWRCADRGKSCHGRHQHRQRWFDWRWVDRGKSCYGRHHGQRWGNGGHFHRLRGGWRHLQCLGRCARGQGRKLIG